MYYRGHDLLPVMPNTREDRNQRVSIDIEELDPRTGQVARARIGPGPRMDHPFLFTLDGRAELTDFLQWIAYRRGRYAEFWVPAWRWALQLAAGSEAADDTITIQSIGYVDAFLPLECRRHLALLTAANGVITITTRRVEDAEDNGDGTETLTLDAALGVTVTPETPVGFLVLVRLESDDVELTWYHTEAAEAVVQLIELPQQLEETA